MDADAVEIRVLGSLVEKQRTTPDTYPLSLNALRLACNQATNREPVVEYEEPTIRAAAGPPRSRGARGGAARERPRRRARGARRSPRGSGRVATQGGRRAPRRVADAMTTLGL